MEEKKKKSGGQQGELMRALDITVDDLLANDEGYISESQAESLMKRQSGTWIGFLFLSIFLSLFGTGFISLAYFNPDKFMPLFLMSLLFFGIGGLTGVGSLWYRHWLKTELAENQVETVQGIVVVNIMLDAGHLEINGVTLNAPPDVLRRVQHLQPYIVHYLPKSKVILSMEHISEDSNIRANTSRLEDIATNSDPIDYIEQLSQGEKHR